MAMPVSGWQRFGFQGCPKQCHLGSAIDGDRLHTHMWYWYRPFEDEGYLCWLVSRIVTGTRTGDGSRQQRRDAGGQRLESLDRDAPEARGERAEGAASAQGDLSCGGERGPRPVARGEVRRPAGPLHERGEPGVCSKQNTRG